MINHIVLSLNEKEAKPFLEKKMRASKLKKRLNIFFGIIFIIVFSIVLLDLKFDYEKDLLFYIVFVFSCLFVLIAKIKEIYLRKIENFFIASQLVSNGYEVKTIRKELFFKQKKDLKEFQVCSFSIEKDLIVYYFTT